MANQTMTVRDTKVSVQSGKNPGPVNSKPQKIEVERVKPGYRPDNKVPKRGGQ